MENMRSKIASMVKAVWKANKENCMDRGTALAMLISNLQHEEREDKTMLYDCGSLTPDEIAEAKEYWTALDKGARGREYTIILDIVNDMEW